MAATYEPIASYTSSSSASTTTFSSIPGTYTDLILVVTGSMSVDNNFRIRFNGDTGTNYSDTRVSGDGSSAASSRASSQTSIKISQGTHTNLGTYSAQIMSYANTNVYKTALMTSAMPASAVNRAVGLWRSTSAITSLTVFTASGNFTDGATMNLFGVKAA
jgi:hypothetical protein